MKINFLVLWILCLFFSSLSTLIGDVQVQSFFAALKALSRKDVHYGAYATSEQVVWVL